jgi:integrase
VADDEDLPPLVSKSGAIYEHGTKGARYSMDCHCAKCKAYAADYQRQWRRQLRTQRASEGGLAKADPRRRDGTEFLMAEVWGRFWNAARDAAGLPEGFTPYNARHTGISWAIDKGGCSVASDHVIAVATRRPMSGSADESVQRSTGV